MLPYITPRYQYLKPLLLIFGIRPQVQIQVIGPNSRYMPLPLPISHILPKQIHAQLQPWLLTAIPTIDNGFPIDSITDDIIIRQEEVLKGTDKFQNYADCPLIEKPC